MHKSDKMIKNIFFKLFSVLIILLESFTVMTAQLYGSFPYSENFTSGSQPSEITLMTPQTGANSTTFTTNGIATYSSRK